ncbi:hypothetical protein [Natronoglycomyces albus]|nr:hypothetical protein [Natronoglycomyces albus]
MKPETINKEADAKVRIQGAGGDVYAGKRADENAESAFCISLK